MERTKSISIATLRSEWTSKRMVLKVRGEASGVEKVEVVDGRGRTQMKESGEIGKRYHGISGLRSG